MDNIDAKLLSFLRRDYRRDATRLNKAFAAAGASSVGFEPSMPPIPYTGDPFELTAGECIAFIGLNPRWRGWQDRWADLEYKPLKRSVDKIRSGNDSEITHYKRLRASYFAPDSTIYYGAYFTRLGRCIGVRCLGLVPEASNGSFARHVFRNHIFKADLLPWFSQNTNCLDWKRVDESTDSAVEEYHDLLQTFLLELRPRWIQCNGKSAKPLIEKLFSVFFNEDEAGFYFGWSNELRAPVILHGWGRFQKESLFTSIRRRLDEMTAAASTR